MHATHQESFSDSPSQGSDVETGLPKLINIVDSLKNVIAVSARSNNERESDLENIAVLAYD